MADREHSQASYVDPQTAIRQLEVKLDVDRRSVEEYFGDYQCECVAWSSRGEKISDGVIITAAYLKKAFHTPPFSDRVEVDQTVELRCVPPDGDPAPQLSWTKNGVTVDPKQDPNYIISNEGNLLIAAAKLSDMANYSCVAENVASRRVSPPARLTVYVDGGWSSWGGWSDCEPQCGSGVMERHRSCDSPPPLNGGQDCVGASRQTADCNSLCPPVAGGWSRYGPWSACDSSCRQYRHRSCSSPAPQHGGAPCQGPDRISRNCSSQLCSGGAVSDLETTRADQAAREIANSDVALYVGLAVALLVFPMIALLALKLYRRKGRRQSLYGLTERDYEARYYDNTKKQLGYAPDLTSSVAIMNPTPPSVNSDYSYGDPNSNKTALLSSPSEHHYDEPQAMFLSKRMDSDQNSGADSETSTMASPAPKANQAGDSGAGQSHSVSSYCSSPTSPRGSSPYCSESVSCRQSLLSITLPSGVNPDNLEFATVTSSGAVLCLPESGVSLTIPEGALASGQQEEVYLAVLNDAKDRPQLAEQQTLLSPVVLVGPSNVQLLRPAIVSFQHCAGLQSSWSVSVLGGSWSAAGGCSWRRLALLGQETLNTAVYAQLDRQRGHLLTETLQPLALLGEPAGEGPAVKRLRLAAFGPRLQSTPAAEYCLRCYVLEDTAAALEAVLRLERRLAGRPLDRPKTMTFQSGAGGLSLALEDLSLGWRCKPQAEFQEIPFRHVWSSSCPLLHCSFSLEPEGQAGVEGPAFSARLLVCQRGGSQTRRQLLRLSSGDSGPPASPAGSLSTGTTSTCSTASSAAPDTGNRLSSETLRKLCECLNPPNSRANDWRMLAKMMQVDRYVNYFAARASPTASLLDLWFARQAEPASAAAELLNMLTNMGRQDAARILQAQLAPTA